MTVHEMPDAPDGYRACRSVAGTMTLFGPLRTNVQTTHLVKIAESGGTPGLTACGMTRFGDDADLPGWGMGNSGVSGPDIEQKRCDSCYLAAASDLAATAAERSPQSVTEL